MEKMEFFQEKGIFPETEYLSYSLNLTYLLIMQTYKMDYMLSSISFKVFYDKIDIISLLNNENLHSLLLDPYSIIAHISIEYI